MPDAMKETSHHARAHASRYHHYHPTSQDQPHPPARPWRASWNPGGSTRDPAALLRAWPGAPVCGAVGRCVMLHVSRKRRIGRLWCCCTDLPAPLRPTHLLLDRLVLLSLGLGSLLDGALRQLGLLQLVCLGWGWMWVGMDEGGDGCGWMCVGREKVLRSAPFISTVWRAPLCMGSAGRCLLRTDVALQSSFSCSIEYGSLQWDRGARLDERVAQNSGAVARSTSAGGRVSRDVRSALHSALQPAESTLMSY